MAIDQIPKFKSDILEENKFIFFIFKIFRRRDHGEGSETVMCSYCAKVE